MSKRTRPRFFLGSATLRAGNGGIARVGRMTAQALIDAGADLKMVSYLDDEPLDIGGVAVACAHGSKLAFLTRCQVAAPARTHFIYDYAGMARAHPILPGLRRPYAVWMHGIEAWEDMRPEIGTALRRADLVLVNTHHTLARFEALHGRLPQARVCLLGTEEDNEASTPDFSDPPTAMILGRMWKEQGQKGHAELIDCWPSVVARVPEARLLIVGGGNSRPELEAMARRSSVSQQIEFTGFVPESEINRVWKRAHVLALPSRQEGFGLVYIEAMQRGLPVIASRQDAGQEINVDGETGYNVDLDQPGALAEAIADLLGDRAKCAAMGAAGQKRWKFHFRYSAFRSRVLDELSAFAGTRLTACV
jgi:phosphatidylinositol alpha-1,6-mannosyltransferase